MTDKPEKPVTDWHYGRAAELANKQNSNIPSPLDINDMKAMMTGRAFAHYIAQHEDPPVDPLLIEAREIVAKVYKEGGSPSIYVDAVRNGQRDNDTTVICALAALKSREVGL